MEAYTRYLTLTPDVHADSSNVFQHYPKLIPHAAMLSLIFIFGHAVVDFWSKSQHKSWYVGLDPKKRTELPSYVMSFAHHIVAVPFSLYHIYMDAYIYDKVDYLQLYAVIVPFTMGYFISDLIMYTLPEALQGRYTYLIHHIFAIVLLIGVLEADAFVVRFLPHMLLMEMSTIFFTMAWFLRLWGFRSSLIVVILELLFVLTFFLVRIVHVPFFLYFIREHLVSMGLCRFCFPPVLLMQGYWFAKIVITLKGRGLGGRKTEMNSGEKKEVKEKKRK